MPETSEERVGAASDCARDVTGSAEHGIEADECECDHENDHPDESKATRGDRQPAETQSQHAQCGCEDEDAAPVRPRLAPAVREKHQPCAGDETTKHADRTGQLVWR